MIPPRLVLGPLAALEPALAAEVRAWKARDPLELPVVLVANTLVGRYLRRRLGHAAGGHVGLRCLTFHEVALLTGAPALIAAGRRPLPRFGRQVLAEEVAAAATGDLATVAQTPGFAAALERLFRELLQAGVEPESLRGALPPSSRNRDLSDLYEAFERRRAAFFTPDDALRAADPARFDAPALLLYGVWDLTAVQRAFLARLAERVPVTVYLPVTGTEADDAHAEQRAWLASLGAREETLTAAEAAPAGLAQLHRRLFGTPAPGPLDGSVLLLSAPDPAREAQEAARACLRWAAEGIPFHEMAVVYRHEEPYRALLDDAFAEAGIPAFFAGGRPLADLPTGRGVRLLLELVGSPLRRAAVMEFLTEVPLPPATAGRYGAEPAAWDAVSREAGIVEGLEQWLDRLRLLRELKQEEADEEEPSGRLRAELGRIDGLLRFIQDLAEHVAAHPQEATWEEHLASLRRLAEQYVDGAGPALAALAPLADLAPLAPRVPLERFRRTATAVLEQTDGSPLLEEVRGGAFGRRGVNVLALSTLPGLRFRAVAVLGLAERDFPPPPRQDPLLPDADRLDLNRRLGWSLPLRALGPDDEPLRFALAAHAARDRLLLSYPRADAGTGRQRLASHFFRAAAEALTGPLPRLEDLDRLDPALSIRVPAGRFGAGTTDAALTEEEYALTLLAADRALGEAWLAAHAPTFRRARAAWTARWEETSLTPYDGMLSGPAAASLARRAGLTAPISPTRLETYATCPFRFFLAYILRLEPVREPEFLERLEPLERGSLVHKVLERFMTEHRDDPPRPERRAAHVERLLAIAREECEARERQGLTGYPLLWELDRRVIVEDLIAWYDLEAAGAGGPLRPAAFELRFGPAWGGEPGDARSVDEPLALALDGLTLRFHGRIDRVDLAPDGSAFHVTDYKTGRVSDDHRDGAFSGGRALQLPIYLLGAAHALGVPWERGEAQYYYATSQGGFRRVRFSGEQLRERWKEFTALLQGLAHGIATGDFHPVPGPQDRHCDRCDFRMACDSRISQIAERKAADPRSAAFVALTEVQ
ncbi:MAG TPA: PD-(D/E)XK nuclease family protein [Dehalococcoidia bacterium]